MADLEGKIGTAVAGDGTGQPIRLGRTGATIVAPGHARYYEAVSRGSVYALTLASTVTGGTILAGNIIGAVAAAVTNFALWNPLNSGKNLSLLKFGISPISGTPTTGAIFHGLLLTAPTVASVGAVRNSLAGSSVGVAGYMASSAGVALTGGSAPVPHSVVDMGGFASAYSSTTYIRVIEDLDGKIVLPPGTGWVPLHPGAGTTMLHGYSIEWEEVAT
jgi:hypothetical protein